MTGNECKAHVCSHKISFILDNFVRRIFQNPERIVGNYIEKGNIAVDLGCGPGFFTIEMAKLAGEDGRVIAVDLQPEMLNKVEKKLKKKNLSERVCLHKCSQDNIDLPENLKADFILIFYMLHEAADQEKILREVKSALNENGKVLIVEPKFHVSETLFKEFEKTAENLGFKIIDRPSDKGGRAMVLKVKKHLPICQPI